MITTDKPNANGKAKLRLSKIGRTANKESEGITSQKTLHDKLIILPVSFVSIYNQMNASKETSGNDAKTPAQNELASLDNSVTATMMNDDKSTLKA